MRDRNRLPGLTFLPRHHLGFRGPWTAPNPRAWGAYRAAGLTPQATHCAILGAIFPAVPAAWTRPTPGGLRIGLPSSTDHCPHEDDAALNGFEGTDMKDMRLEAEAVVNDVLFAVNNMYVSKTLRCADDVAYINVETREGNRYCLELTEAGLRVVGYAFDQVDDHLQTPYHETVYSLLDTLSPAYREAFGNALLQRLEALNRDGQS